MEKLQIVMEQDKETKRTIRYRAADDEVVDSVYIAKRAFNGTPAPRRVLLEVSPEA